MGSTVNSFEDFQTSPILSYQRVNFAKRLENWAFYIFKSDNCSDYEQDYAAKQRMILINFSNVIQTSMDVVRRLFFWSPDFKTEKLKEYILRIDFLWKRLGEIVESVILVATGMESFSIDGWNILDREKRADAMVDLQQNQEMSNLIADIDAFNWEAGDTVTGMNVGKPFWAKNFKELK